MKQNHVVEPTELVLDKETYLQLRALDESISDAEWDCDPNTLSDEQNHRFEGGI